MKSFMYAMIMALLLTPALSFGQWIDTKIAASDHLRYIIFTDNQNGHIAGNEQMYKTTNGGLSWVATGGPVSHGALQFYNANIGLAVGGTQINRTTDGGNSWQSIYTSPFGSFFDLHFLSPDVVLSAEGDAMGKSTNGGANWTWHPISLGPGLSFRKFAAHEGKLYGLMQRFGSSTADSLLVSTDNGGSWTTKAGPCGVDIASNNGVLFIAGTSRSTKAPTISRSSDNGVSWQEWSLPELADSSARFRRLAFKDNIGFALGLKDAGDDTYFCYKTTDNGLTWTKVMETSTYLNYVDVTDTKVFITSDSGTVFSADIHVGITTISTEVPSGYSLKQNYPNPFNPTTNINFDLPKQTKAKLTVFDISGKQVEVLVDEVLSAGSYNYDFQAKNLTSGVYFYRLETDKFVEVRKMMLVK